MHTYIHNNKWSVHYASLLAMFNLLHNTMNQELYDKHLCNQISYYKKIPLMCTPHAVPIKYHLKSEVSIMLCFQLCYVAVQIRN